MTRALILGTLHGQVDAMEALRRRDVEVHACGHERVGPGVDIADRFWPVDITDAAAVAALAEDISADLVYSVGSDIAMPTVVAVSEDLGLPHFHSTALTAVLRDKALLRERLRLADLSPVEHVVVAADEPSITWTVYPSIVKPVDSQGQRGISIVRSPDELEGAIDVARSASRSGAVIVEELLEGSEVSIHVFVQDGVVKFFLPSDRHVWTGPLVGIPQAHSVPLSSQTSGSHTELVDVVSSFVREFQVEYGPLYFQLILTVNGPRIIEVASRLDGCHLWRLIGMSTGFDFLDAVLGSLLGEDWPENPVEPIVNPMTLEFFLGTPDSPVTAEGAARLVDPGAAFVEMQVDEGAYPRRTNDVVARLGYQISRGN